MATKSIMDKIRGGVGMEDPQVKKYIEGKVKLKNIRLEGYKKRDELIRKFEKENK